jgi:hypothetical protein
VDDEKMSNAMKSLGFTTFIIVFLILTNSCSVFYSKFQTNDPFYQSTGGLDFLRIPLIKPYDAIKGNEKLGWEIDMKTNDTYYISIKGIEKIAIEKGIILIYTPYNEESAEGLGEKILYWFALIPSKGIEKGFDNEDDFIKYIQDYGIREPTWLDPNAVFKQFDKTGCLQWIPDCKN